MLRNVHGRKRSKVSRLTQWVKFKLDRTETLGEDFPPPMQATLLKAPIPRHAHAEFTTSVNDTLFSNHGDVESENEDAPAINCNGTQTRGVDSDLINVHKNHSDGFLYSVSSGKSVSCHITSQESQSFMDTDNQHFTQNYISRSQDDLTSGMVCKHMESATPRSGGARNTTPHLKHSISEPTILDVSSDTQLDARSKRSKESGGVLSVLRLAAIKRLLTGDLRGQESSKKTDDCQRLYTSNREKSKADRTSLSRSNPIIQLPADSSEPRNQRKSPLQYIRSLRRSKQEPAKKSSAQIAKAKAKSRSLPQRARGDDSILRRRNTAKAKLFRSPSIERLDTTGPRNRTYTDISNAKYKRKSRGSVIRKSKLAKPKEESPSDIGFTAEDEHLAANQAELLRVRSGSDPCVTFKMIEEKVLSRKQTKKWHKNEKRRTMEQNQYQQVSNRNILEKSSTLDTEENNSTPQVELTSSQKAHKMAKTDLIIQKHTVSYSVIPPSPILTWPTEKYLVHDTVSAKSKTAEEEASGASKRLDTNPLRCQITNKTDASKASGTRHVKSVCGSTLSDICEVHGEGDTQDGTLSLSQLSLLTDPHQRWVFTGYHSSGEGSDRETVL